MSDATYTFPRSSLKPSHSRDNTFKIVVLYFYLLKFSTNAVCGAKTRLKPGAYDSRDGLPNSGLHIEGIYVAINATATPVRLARINWAIGGIFPDFRYQNKDIRSRLQSSQSCVTPSAIFVFAYHRDTCDDLWLIVRARIWLVKRQYNWNRDSARKSKRSEKQRKARKAQIPQDTMLLIKVIWFNQQGW